MNWRLILRNTTLHGATVSLLALGGFIAGVPFLFAHPSLALFVSILAMSALMHMSYKPLRRALQPGIDHLLFADRFSYLEVLETLPNDLLEFTNLREMLEYLIAKLIAVAKLERVRVFMHDPGHQSYVEMVFRGALRGAPKAAERPAQLSENGALAQWLRDESRLWTLDELRAFPKFMAGNGWNELKQLGAAACFPINKEDELLGIVILGPKRSGEAFNPHDLKILRSLRRRLENFLTQAMVLTQEALNMVKDSHDMKNDVNALKGRISWRAMRLASWWIDFEKEMASLENQVMEESSKHALDVLKERSTEYYADAQRGLPIEEHAISRMAHHLRNWAEFGRVVAEGFRGRRPQETVNVGQAARLSVDRWKPMAEKKNLELSVETPDTLSIWGERNLLEQIIENLIDNALKATERGFVRVVCRLEQNDILIEVIDSGCGIAEKDLAGIFDKPFSHVRSRKKFDQSTGVGLYLVAQYTRGLGGRVFAESRLGQGSTFRVVLPVSHKKTKPAEAAALAH